MFRHLLVPTDGSPESEAAARQAAALARALGGRITGLCVKPRFRAFTLRPEAVEDTAQDSWDEDRHAREALAALERAAAQAGVPFEGVTVEASQPWKAILDEARARGCDAVALASHGRTGLGGALLGSVTRRVLAHASIPVVVYRKPAV
ncbi:MAG TPA: universal stress protein [Anaeromyxobacteraceae bacterium]|nr:universal stress protein [Anaeromyxobacteraceae bacterium]